MKEQDIRLSVVSYLNAKPFMRGLAQLSPDDKTFRIETDIPSVCAQKLIEDKTDIGLIPVAMIPRLQESHIITDYCIAADGAVDSVLLVSQCQINEITHIQLDLESRTSVLLARILADEHWKISPKWIPQAPNHDFSDADKTGAAVIIGDKALEHRHHYKYCYDLAAAWKAHTGLPFVFAAWVSNKLIAPAAIEKLNQLFSAGIKSIPETSKEIQVNYPYANVLEYLTHRIRYQLNSREKEAMQLFLRKAAPYQESGAVVTI